MPRYALAVCLLAILMQPRMALVIASEAHLTTDLSRIAKEDDRASEILVKLATAPDGEMPPTTLGTRSVSFLEEQKKVLDIDRRLNSDLEALYRRATTVESAERSEWLIRTALLHWTVLLRRASMQTFHSEVAGLSDDPDCAGDIVADQLLQRYFEALFAQNDRRSADAVSALAALARQSACLGTQQSAVLASALYSSYAELRAFLRMNGLYEVVPYVAQVASGPLLLFYDVEKYRGPQGPLARWFSENRELLVQAVEAQRHPALWHRLWLYDRRSGRLLGYSHSARPVGENEVDLARFWASIATLENLGTYACSFAEMIERGADALGYFCAGSSCERQAAGGAWGWGRSLQEAVSNETRLTACQLSSPRGGEGGASPCGQGIDIRGASRASDTVRCLSEEIVRPGTEAFKCIAEATGLCSDPVEKLVKSQELTSFAGVKMGKRCEVSDAEDVHFAIRDWLGWTDNEEKVQAARKEIERLEKERETKQTPELKAAQEERRAAETAAKETPTAENKNKLNDVKKNESAKVREWFRVAEKIRDEEKKIEKVAEEERKKEEERRKKEEEKKKKEAEEKKASGSKHCPPDTPQCGDNECTGMSEAARTTLQCMKQALDPEARDPYRSHPGGCNPQICDPIDPQNPSNASLLKCFGPMEGGAEGAVARQCWQVNCGPGEVAVLSAAGQCMCQQASLHGGPGAGRLGGLCGRMDCAEGTPIVGPFGCTCVPSNTGGAGSPPVPPASVRIPEPPSISDVNPGAGSPTM